jgi:hypothetical protein
LARKPSRPLGHVRRSARADRSLLFQRLGRCERIQSALHETNGGANQCPIPIITCPKCSHEIKLNESLAAPLLEKTRKQFQSQLAAKETGFEKRAEQLNAQQQAINQAKQQLEEQVAARLKTERAQIAAAEAKKAREAAALELETKAKETADLREQLESNIQPAPVLEPGTTARHERWSSYRTAGEMSFVRYRRRAADNARGCCEAQATCLRPRLPSLR